MSNGAGCGCPMYEEDYVNNEEKEDERLNPDPEKKKDVLRMCSAWTDSSLWGSSRKE